MSRKVGEKIKRQVENGRQHIYDLQVMYVGIFWPQSRVKELNGNKKTKTDGVIGAAESCSEERG